MFAVLGELLTDESQQLIVINEEGLELVCPLGLKENLSQPING